MVLQLNEKHLGLLCKMNSFPVPKKGMVFFGLRGCLPVNGDDYDFQGEHSLDLAQIDHIHPGCTLGQWLPKDGKIALFPGSTVPHIRYIKDSKERNGQGANQLMTGYYKDYRKGIHKAGSSTAHEAFKQTEAHPIRRTADDFDFDNDDRVEFGNPYDNLHAAWSMGVEHDEDASAGCQVVVGFPKCEKRQNQPDVGPWKRFKENAYELEQDSFPYILLTGREAQQVILNGGQKVSPRLRFGSKVDLAAKVQKALQEKRFYEGKIDGDFGERTLRAVLQFQTTAFGPSADDGIVGPMTASALGITWPKG